MRFSSITGILPGSVVTVSGYRVGQVVAISPGGVDGKREFEVEISVTSGWRIPVDSVARIVSPGLLASYQIDIVEGESPRIIDPGDTIRGEPPVSLTASVNAVADQAATYQSAARPSGDGLHGPGGGLRGCARRGLPQLPERFVRVPGTVGLNSGTSLAGIPRISRLAWPSLPGVNGASGQPPRLHRWNRSTQRNNPSGVCARRQLPAANRLASIRVG